jgi:hypothetical protein
VLEVEFLISMLLIKDRHNWCPKYVSFLKKKYVWTTSHTRASVVVNLQPCPYKCVGFSGEQVNLTMTIQCITDLK